ncbi:MAG TPA: response regulator [Methylovirgula sp.]|nr:response regulator [Methylovirgula sp.]
MASAAFTEKEIRFLVEKNADGILVLDAEGIVLFANPASEQIFGRAPESLIGSPIGVPLVSGDTSEIVIHKPGGKHVDAEIRVVDTYWDNRPARLASIRDISRRKAQEEQLRHSSKMEAIGRLTAGIAHDFNNLLTVVLGNLEHAQRQTDDERLAVALDNAAHGARLAAVLTERLLAFARKKPLEPKLVSPNSIVAGMSELLQRTLGDTINIRTVLAEDLHRVEVDQTELEAAILNLIVNARDAMPSGGEVIVETANIELDHAYAARETEIAPGPYVMISVTDSGVGMSPEILRQVFEPFFTTKEGGRGTGLGLSQVYGFVKQSGGHVKLYSEPGHGTIVKIYLPKAMGDPFSQEPSIEQTEPLSTGHETILIVEDDPDVRAYAASGLRGLGYKVFEAGEASSALEIIENEPTIQLLFTDLGLPGGMDGKALAACAQSMREGLKVLITTAYAGSALVHEGRLDPGVDLLSKPFTLGSLGRRLREILDRRSSRKAGSARVLVAEDEVLLRMFIADSLADHGYELEQAGSCAEAMAKFRALSGDLAAAIIDLGLPDRPGDELVAELRAVSPDLPIIVTTGLSQADVAARYVRDRRLRVLGKPFSPQALVDALRGLVV